jgi:hypothetical protein
MFEISKELDHYTMYPSIKISHSTPKMCVFIMCQLKLLHVTLKIKSNLNIRVTVSAKLYTDNGIQLMFKHCGLKKNRKMA